MRHMRRKTRILWVSNHSVRVEQITALQQIFGSVKIDFVPEELRTASFMSVEKICKYFWVKRYDEMVVVAPLSVIQKITEKGFKPLYAKCNAVPVAQGDWAVNGKGYRFDRFVRVTAVKMETQELTPC